jgi:hypothetical protein
MSVFPLFLALPFNARIFIVTLPLFFVIPNQVLNPALNQVQGPTISGSIDFGIWVLGF